MSLESEIYNAVYKIAGNYSETKFGRVTNIAAVTKTVIAPFVPESFKEKTDIQMTAYSHVVGAEVNARFWLILEVNN